VMKVALEDGSSGGSASAPWTAKEGGGGEGEDGADEGGGPSNAAPPC
jgi:hypothetical protein